MIEIESAWLIDALDNHDSGVHHYLDLQTGEILRFAEEFEEEEEIQEAYTRMEEQPERWVEIEGMPSSESFQIMEDFVCRLPAGEEKRTLERALSWKKPFSNFKQALYEMSQTRMAWFKFHDARLRKEAEEWLAANSIEAKLT